MASNITKIISKGFADVFPREDGTSDWVQNMTMWGGTIPQNVEINFSVTVNVDDDTLTQIATKLAAAARAYATANGITVNANKVFLINYTGF